jgi:hypothetical protein
LSIRPQVASPPSAIRPIPPPIIAPRDPYRFPREGMIATSSTIAPRITIIGLNRCSRKPLRPIAAPIPAIRPIPPRIATPVKS